MPRLDSTLLVSALLLLSGCAPADPTEPTPSDAPAIAPATWADPALRARLLEQRDRDQDARLRMIDLNKRRAADPTSSSAPTEGELADAARAVRELDAESIDLLRGMIDRHGWPTFDLVGEDGAHAAWLLLQHADQDPALQARALALLEPLVARGQADAESFAMLTDRVRVARGERQVYGTQFLTDDAGVLRPRPTEDWAHIDQKRAEVGLGTIDEYVELLAELYGIKVDSRPLDADD